MAGPRACAHRRRVARKQRAARSARYAAACPPPPFPCRRWQRPVWRSFRFRTSDYTKLTIDYRVLPKSAGQPWAGRGGRGGRGGEAGDDEDVAKTWRRRDQDPAGRRHLACEPAAAKARSADAAPDATGRRARTRPDTAGGRDRDASEHRLWRDDPATREALAVTLRDVRVGAAGADEPAICALTAL
jgi:hypothetical protein